MHKVKFRQVPESAKHAYKMPNMLMLIKNGDLSPLRNLLKFTIPPL